VSWSSGQAGPVAGVFIDEWLREQYSDLSIEQ
jgi:hypothetical protein